jgi:hydroxymethylglutaryl-CoA synthase
MIGIISYGSYIPKYRLSVEEIAGVWGKDAKEITGSLGIKQKSVAAIDEDAVTLAVEAGEQALACSSVDAKDIGALFIGSESHPYAVNPSATIVGEYLGLSNNYLAADFEFACKAGSAGIQAIAGLITSKQIDVGLAIGSDTAQSQPHDALEYSSASAAVAFLLGTSEHYPLIAELRSYTSYSSDTPDFWRRDGIRYPSHAGRFTGEPSYFAHVMGSSKALFEKTNTKASDYTYCVFHMPNGKFPRDVAKRLGFSQEQLAPSLTVDLIGNPYSASSLLGLAAVLDQAKPGETIFMASYGSGAGSDAFVWKVMEEKSKVKSQNFKKVTDQCLNTISISYVQYLKQTHKV